jgi:uracil-DNA glycosylase
MQVQIEESWKNRLAPEFEKDYFRVLTELVRSGVYSLYHLSSGEADFQRFQPLSV